MRDDRILSRRQVKDSYSRAGERDGSRRGNEVHTAAALV